MKPAVHGEIPQGAARAWESHIGAISAPRLRNGRCEGIRPRVITSGHSVSEVKIFLADCA